ncbi:MAG: hypothetical protein EU539_03890 [Promethearchaeota archaeon]|nr:MAG: hypothetical protein EU539_03890 [Candidatus Lokiarchaeota archaeon]
MSLDKWIKTDDEEEQDSEGKKHDKLKSSKSSKAKIKKGTKKKGNQNTQALESHKLKKFTLICSKKSCGYQKTLMKKNLSDKDRICPRCKNQMKIK